MPDVVSQAKAILNKHKGTLYGVYSDSLGKEIASIALNQTAVAAEVFTQIIEQGYDVQVLIDVSRAFLDSLAPAQLSQLAKNTSGSILLVRVKGFLNCSNEKFISAPRCMKIDTAFRIAGLGVEAGLTATLNNTSEPRQLSKEEMDFYRNYNQTSDVMWNFRNSKWNKLGPRVNFNDDICWDLPTSGVGFTTYNVDDLKGKRNDKHGYDQIGTKETIDAIIEIGRQWSNMPLDANELRQDLEIGDISRPGGINTPDHGTHMNGKIFDLRLLRKVRSDGKGFEYTDSSKYSFSLTKKFLLLVVRLYPGTTFYFNDPAINKDRETDASVKTSDSSHNNHIHVMFPGGVE